MDEQIIKSLFIQQDFVLTYQKKDGAVSKCSYIMTQRRQ